MLRFMNRANALTVFGLMSALFGALLAVQGKLHFAMVALNLGRRPLDGSAAADTRLQSLGQSLQGLEGHSLRVQDGHSLAAATFQANPDDHRPGGLVRPASAFRFGASTVGA